MSPRTVLITGTDTGVGKTVIACGLARRLAAGGSRVVAIKPVETGCAERPGDDEDGVLLAAAAGQSAPRSALVRLRTPVAPPVAADREGCTLSAAAWCEEIRRLGREADVLLVEGAGGLLSPLTWEETALDLATNLAASVIVVAADRLGTLNHTLLSLRVLAAAGISRLGAVFVAPAVADDTTGTNADALRRVDGETRIASVPWLANVEEAANHLGAVAGWTVA